jgi:hypothetical protein
MRASGRRLHGSPATCPSACAAPRMSWRLTSIGTARWTLLQSGWRRAGTVHVRAVPCPCVLCVAFIAHVFAGTSTGTGTRARHAAAASCISLVWLFVFAGRVRFHLLCVRVCVCVCVCLCVCVRVCVCVRLRTGSPAVSGAQPHRRSCVLLSKQRRAAAGVLVRHRGHRPRAGRYPPCGCGGPGRRRRL